MTELLQLVQEWEIGKCFIENYDAGHHEINMANVWKQWIAWRAYTLYLELPHRPSNPEFVELVP